MKKMFMVCALVAGAFATAQVAHADSFTFTFIGSTGSGHNQQTISGTVTFDAPAGGGAITNPDGSITFTSGETSPPPNNFHTGTFNVSGPAPSARTHSRSLTIRSSTMAVRMASTIMGWA